LIFRKSNELPKPTLAYLSTEDVKPFLGPEPFFGQGSADGELVSESGDQHSVTLAARHRNPRLVFLGLHEPSNSNALPSSEFADPETAISNLSGTAYFALDVLDLDLTPTRLEEILSVTSVAQQGGQLSWSEPRSVIQTLDAFSSGIFASARSMIDWNQRNKFCPACGSPTYSLWGGWKIACTTLLPWAENGDRKPCLSGKGLHNFTHPRTDAVVIMIAIDETGDKILLGRGKKFPGKFYSALAGFIEPGETFEDAVAREMWEEAGISVWDVRYHSGQPWPYPANLMVGFYARADASQKIRVDLDNELVDARWYTRDEVRDVLNHPHGGIGRTDYKKLAAYDEGKVDSTQLEETPKSVPSEEPPFRLPPETAIAGLLIRDWVDGKIGFKEGHSKATSQKNNL